MPDQYLFDAGSAGDLPFCGHDLPAYEAI